MHRRRQGRRALEFGVKASIVSNNRRAPGGLFVLHARAPPDNPYDGHTLRDVIGRTETLISGQKRAFSVSSSASCAAPPSSPSSDT